MKENLELGLMAIGSVYLAFHLIVLLTRFIKWIKFQRALSSRIQILESRTSGSISAHADLLDFYKSLGRRIFILEKEFGITNSDHKKEESDELAFGRWPYSYVKKQRHGRR